MSDVFVFDDLHPEDNAMVQALYSRSPASVLSHREKVEEVGSGRFMDSFYVGYGHASIGDCGSTTVFTENVSMLVAKAEQDNPLYSGQEASTRYLDFSQQPQYDPYNHAASKAILSKWLDLYNHYMPIVIEGLKKLHPFNPETDKSEKGWVKTIEVRAFDVLRSLLPVGTTTLLSWHTNLRQARDQLRYLSSHPLKEVRDIALRTFESVQEKYPHSFHGEEMDPDSERYRERNEYAIRNSLDTHYLTPEVFLNSIDSGNHIHVYNGGVITDSVLDKAVANDPSLLDRPRGAPLPRKLMKYGVFNLYFLLDFGSYRDLQRHRNGYCPVPLVTNEFGFYHGYDNELRRILSDIDYVTLADAIERQLYDIENLHEEGIETDPVNDQYLYPMGMACGCMVSYSLPQMVYVSELRSGKTVHFTLRPIAQDMGDIVKEQCPMLNLYIDYDEDSFTTKRGEQDIVEKE